MLERLGENQGKQLFALSLDEFRLPEEGLRLPSPNFLCLLAADFSVVTDGEIAALVQHLIDCGASYFVCWGQGCERAHDIIDDVVLLLDCNTDDSVIMTSWHDDEPLDEALFFLLCYAWPDAYFEDTTGCTVAVTVASHSSAGQVRVVLSDPDEFIAKVTAA